MYIFLAEDNQADVLLVRQALRLHRIEHDLVVARDGAEALCHIERMGAPGGDPCPDLVLLDLNLPKADGVEVLTALRSQSACAETPVIVVTSSGAAKDRARMEGLGISSYFRKPVDLDSFMQLGAVVSQVMSART